MRASALLGLLGLFSILSAVFTGAATLADWHDGHEARLASDLKLVAIAAISALVFVPLARWRAGRQSAVERTDRLSPAGTIGFGILFASFGVLMLGIGAYHAAQARNPSLDDFMFVPAAMIFVLGGAMVASAAAPARVRMVLGASLFTAFAITFDWVAFAPGERHFAGGLSIGWVAVGLTPGPWLGRVLFGIPALGATIGAAVAWARLLRRD